MFKRTAIITMLASILVIGTTVVSCAPVGGTTGDSTNTGGLTLVSEYDGTEVFTSLAINGDYLYTGAGYDGVLTFDVSNPSNITKLTADTNKYTTSVPVSDVVIKDVGGTIYCYAAVNVGIEGGIAVITVADGTNLSEKAVNIAIADHSPNALCVLSTDGKVVIAADEKEGLSGYDVDFAAGPPATVAEAAGAVAPLNANYAGDTLGDKTGKDIAVDGGYAYVAAGGDGVFIVDVSAGVPSIDGRITSLLTYVNAVAVDSDVLVIADMFGGILIYDVTTPTTPKLQSRYSTTGEAKDVVISGDNIFVADGSYGLLWLDITDTKKPTLKGSYASSTGFADKIAYLSGYLYVSYGSDGIKVLEKEQ